MSLLSSFSVEDSTHALIVVNDRGGEGEEGTTVDGVLLPITRTTITGSTGVNRAVRSAMMQQRHQPPTKMTTMKSAKIQCKLELAMVPAITRAEERLIEMECKTDELSLVVSLYGDNNNTVNSSLFKLIDNIIIQNFSIATPTLPEPVLQRQKTMTTGLSYVGS